MKSMSSIPQDSINTEDHWEMIDKMDTGARNGMASNKIRKMVFPDDEKKDDDTRRKIPESREGCVELRTKWALGNN